MLTQPQSFHNQCEVYEVDTGMRQVLTSDERAHIKALERENRELRRANEILKLGSAFFAQAQLDRKLK